MPLPQSRPPVSPYRLSNLLKQLFSEPSELRAWIDDLVGQTTGLDDLTEAVAWAGSTEEVARATARALGRRMELHDDDEQALLRGTLLRHCGDRRAAIEGVLGPPPTTPAPRPRQSDPALLEASDALVACFEERDAASAEGRDTAEVEARIRDLSQRLRRGPVLRAGEVLDGRYLLVQSLGQGGFGRVWHAWDRVVGRDVAVKVVHPQWTIDDELDAPSAIDRVFSGARRMAELRHPGIVRVLRSHVEDRGFHFLVMAYLPDGDLHRAVIRGMPNVEAARSLLTAGEALAFAHHHGLVHRDVKPHNVLLGASGVVLADFDFVSGVDATRRTHTGVAIGTVAYAAPELLEDASRADWRADLYGLAMSVVFCLAGRDLPVREVMYAPQTYCARLGFPADLLRLLDLALARDPSDRDLSVVAFCAGVRQALEPFEASTPFDDLDPRGRIVIETWHEETNIHVAGRTVRVMGKRHEVLRETARRTREGGSVHWSSVAEAIWPVNATERNWQRTRRRLHDFLVEKGLAGLFSTLHGQVTLALDRNRGDEILFHDSHL